MRAHLTKAIIGSFILKITSTACALLISIMLARTLGAAEYGYYAYAMAIIGLLAVPTQLGLPTLIIRQIATYKTKEQWSLIRGLLLRANQAVLIISLVLIFITFCIAWKFSNYIPSLSFTVLCIALAMLPLIGLGSLRSATLRGLNHILLGQLPENIVRQGMFILLIVLFILMFGTDKINSNWAMGLQVISAFIAFTVGAILLFKYLPEQTKKTIPEYDTQAWIRSALPLLIAGGMNIINRRADIIMLGVFTNSEFVGIYQVVTRGADLIPFALLAVNNAVAPVISKFYVCNEINKLQRTITVSTGAILIYSLPLTCVLFFLGSWILPSVFGTEFALGSTALAILSVGQLVNAGMGSVGFILSMTGHEKDTAMGVFISAVVNIILNLIFIPKWGIEGAASATSISLIVWNLLLAFYVYKRLQIYPSILGIMIWKSN